VTVERCDECGFDGSEWTDQAALDAVANLPGQWRTAVSGLTVSELHRRPLSDRWSIAEYADHVREVLFGMRFLLDVAVGQPGTDLGASPVPRFDPEPRAVDLDATLARIDEEVTLLRMSFAALATDAWASMVVLDGEEIDPHWIARHTAHDPTHHLLDIERLRKAL
jgi:hypothetical protein